MSNSDAKKAAESVREIAYAWKESPYYDDAEKWTEAIFWRPGSIFLSCFSKLNLSSVIELACGHGRHADRMSVYCKSLTLIDVHPENIEFCKERLKTRQNITYIVNDGLTFTGVPDESITAIFCYDAMVHFSPIIIENYLHETRRVLKPGGMALFHHSNLDAPQDSHYGANPLARNHMTFELMSKLSEGAGLEIVESHKKRWGMIEDIDRVTLFRKP